MTRRFILTTATLATILASGASPAAASSSPAAASRTRSTLIAATPQADEAATIVALGPHLAGVAGRGPLIAGRDWPVTLFLDTPLAREASLHLWVGRKNAWGATLAGVRPVTGLPGWFSARVPVPGTLRADLRLWLGLDQGDGHLLRSSVALPV